MTKKGKEAKSRKKREKPKTRKIKEGRKTKLSNSTPNRERDTQTTRTCCARSAMRCTLLRKRAKSICADTTNANGHATKKTAKRKATTAPQRTQHHTRSAQHSMHRHASECVAYVARDKSDEATRARERQLTAKEKELTK